MGIATKSQLTKRNTIKVSFSYYYNGKDLLQITICSSYTNVLSMLLILCLLSSFQ